MIEYQFRPVQSWPGPLTRDRRRSQFKASYNDTLQLLDRELFYLRARQVVIQLALREADIRRDGLPRSGARPDRGGNAEDFKLLQRAKEVLER